jgi:hypothetical protein
MITDLFVNCSPNVATFFKIIRLHSQVYISLLNEGHSANDVIGRNSCVYISVCQFVMNMFMYSEAHTDCAQCTSVAGGLRLFC